jgi:hypothetical protein
MNNTNQQQDLMETLNQLSQKMDVAAEKLWPVLVNKTRLESILFISSGVFFALGSYILLCLLRSIDK